VDETASLTITAWCVHFFAHTKIAQNARSIWSVKLCIMTSQHRLFLVHMKSLKNG